MRQINQAACSVCVVCAITAITSPAQTLNTLFSFDGADGALPEAALVQGTDGNLYGTTVYGGASNWGTVFKITPEGALTTVHSFNWTDGALPEAAPIQGVDGNLYGTTFEGGANDVGTVFKIAPSGVLTTLYSFCSQNGCPDGDGPHGGVVQGMDGNLYGTTLYGGANGEGIIFKITPNGGLTVVYSFCAQADCRDGATPFAGLVLGIGGNFYGTTEYGGAASNICGDGGCGTAFKITPSGTLTTLHTFCSQTGCSDGALPIAGLVQGSDGSLYGTTFYGGAVDAGTIFKVTPAGTLTTLYSFCSQTGCADGADPIAGLVQGTDGNFYGTTYYGDSTAFKVTPSGILTTLHSFCCYENPAAGLIQDTNGEFYGTTAFGGTSNDGTVFSLSVGLQPFVETQPAFGKVGAPVKILGTNLSGATRVTFHGTTATFTVVSPSLITTTVPGGATSGTIEVVVTSNRTLSSNVPFRVRP